MTEHTVNHRIEHPTEPSEEAEAFAASFHREHPKAGPGHHETNVFSVVVEDPDGLPAGIIERRIDSYTNCPRSEPTDPAVARRRVEEALEAIERREADEDDDIDGNDGVE